MCDGTEAAPAFKRLPPRSGTLGNLSEEQKRKYEELDNILKADPEIFVSANARESRQRRLLRHLRGWGWDVQKAEASVRAQSVAWKKYRLDNFTEEDELNEYDTLFACGHDLWGRPTVVARPAVFFSESENYSKRAAHRCAFTLTRVVDSMFPGIDQFVVLYDIRDVGRANLDMVFARELIACMQSIFCERLAQIVVLNSRWSMMFFWAAISPMLASRTRNKIHVFGEDIGKSLLDLLPPDHPYYCYALQTKGLSYAEREKVPPPRKTVFVPRWAEALAWDACETSRKQDRDMQSTSISIRLQKYLSLMALNICCLSRSDKKVEHDHIKDALDPMRSDNHMEYQSELDDISLIKYSSRPLAKRYWWSCCRRQKSLAVPVGASLPYVAVPFAGLAA